MGIKNFFVNEKAMLEILDLREIGEAKREEVAKSGKKTAAVNMTNIGSISPAKKLANAMSNTKMKEALVGTGNTAGSNSALQFVASSVLGDTLDAAGDLEDASGLQFTGIKKTFEVQFNPSDLQIEGYGGGRIATTNFDKTDDKSKEGSANITYQPAPVNIRLSVKLLFDNMDPNECFLSAKTNIALSELAKSGIKKALTKLNKKLTVQQEVEGLIAALRSPYTRRITFYWGDMCYSGVLNRVSSQYTMFNTAGEPVRAVVQLSLICADETVSSTSMGAWENAYYEAFGGGNKSLVNVTQKFGNLLNIKL